MTRNIYFVDNSLLFPTVKELSKSTNNLLQKFDTMLFFETV